MKLALITGEFPPMQGGVGDYTREVVLELTRRNHHVTVVTTEAQIPNSKPQTANPNEPSSGFQVQPPTAPDSSSFTIQHSSFAFWRSLSHIHQLTHDCDLVHIQYQSAAYGMTPPIHFLPRYLRWKDPRRKVIVTFHDLKVPYLFPKAGPLRWRAVLFLAQSCHAVVVTNQEDEQTLRASISNLPSPVTLIPIGSNIDPHVVAIGNRLATRASIGVAPDEWLLCYFGFLNASKGGETLMRVLAEVQRALHRRGSVRLLMIGGEVGASDPTNVAYAQRVRALMHDLALDDAVIWAGYRTPAEVTALWRASDIAVLPYTDGASLRRGTLMAAIAHAMPIVTTTPRVPVSQFRGDKNMLLAAPDDVNALSAQVLALIESSALRERLSQGAAQLAHEFTWARIVDQHLALYQQLAVIA